MRDKTAKKDKVQLWMPSPHSKTPDVQKPRGSGLFNADIIFHSRGKKLFADIKIWLHQMLTNKWKLLCCF